LVWTPNPEGNFSLLAANCLSVHQMVAIFVFYTTPLRGKEERWHGCEGSVFDLIFILLFSLLVSVSSEDCSLEGQT